MTCEGWHFLFNMLYLSANAPVKPSHIGRVSKKRVNSTRDQHVTLGLLVLHYVVEVGPCRQHGRLTQTLSAEDHEQSHPTEPV